MADVIHGKRILVGLSGGIACYKTAYVVSQLAQQGAEVTVAMTESATRFVAPLTFEALSGRPVYTSQWDHYESHDPQHISLAKSIDVMVIAPCTMNMISKLAHGRTDDVVSLIASAVDWAHQRLFIAPSMNETMWNQPANQRNIEQLKEDGVTIIGPGSGWQACRTVGIGRMAEPEEILNSISQNFASS